ncbi:MULTISPECIES: hypothetical protein [unclassified Streptomyces]|uniref:hypothetical protein n=1 Tax=unclassified Streptomyces TaxID=2593676 RepID=UPI002E3380EC|nr:MULTISPECIES: hypothetical protein [unclassified Streptomyces]WUC63354.1 hypothetical protein OG861_03500 [Streptomyces sp. NBC_00539]
MTQSTPQPSDDRPADAGEAKAVPADASPAGRRGRLVRLTRQGRTRGVALGLVVLVGGAAAAVAVAEHRHEEREGHASFAREHGRGDGPKAGRAQAGPHADGPRGGRGTEDGAPGWRRPGREGGGAKPAAPAPLPSLPATQAVDKAAGAVSGGKVESLRVVVEQGGASAWDAVVLGPDGVRHDVTLSGSDGTVTGNSVREKGPKAPR